MPHGQKPAGVVESPYCILGGEKDGDSSTPYALIAFPPSRFLHSRLCPKSRVFWSLLNVLMTWRMSVTMHAHAFEVIR